MQKRFLHITKRFATYLKYHTWLYEDLLPWRLWWWAVGYLDEEYDSKGI